MLSVKINENDVDQNEEDGNCNDICWKIMMIIKDNDNSLVTMIMMEPLNLLQGLLNLVAKMMTIINDNDNNLLTIIIMEPLNLLQGLLNLVGQ